jgi:hypothetical protein
MLVSLMVLVIVSKRIICVVGVAELVTGAATRISILAIVIVI